MYFLLQKKGDVGDIQRVDEEKVPSEVKENFPKPEEIHGCGFNRVNQMLMGCIQMPIQEEGRKQTIKQQVPLLGQGHIFRKFSFGIGKDEIWFVDYDGLLVKIIDNGEDFKEISVSLILYRIFCKLVEKDVQVLDIIYKQLATLESEIPRDNARFFLQKMYTMKHSIYQLFRFYHQLTEMSEDLMEWDSPLLDEQDMVAFEKFIVRTKRLSDDMEIMREYAMEIWEIYQSQINIRQNDIMKVLTIVTTIFLPLSLLAAWYGMNFEHMPEISWKYGYPMVIIVSISIIVFCLLLFRRKKYW